jgi:hypothetical protein
MVTENGEKDRGSGEIIAGGALGALAACEAAVGVAVCPLCVIVAPVLIGVGAYKRLKTQKKS